MAVVEVGSGSGQSTGTQNTGSQRVDKDAGNAIKLTDLFAKCSSQGGWSGDAAEYLQAIRKILEDASMPVKATMHYLNDDAVTFNTSDKNSIVLVRENDIVNIQALIADAKFYSAKDAFYAQFPAHKLINIVSCSRFMFARPSQMAAYITQALLAQQSDDIKEFNINNFGDRYQVIIDTDFANVRSFFDMYSPSPTICGDFGFIASITDKADQRFNNFQSSNPMFGVTGYVEFVRNEANGTFTPIVHVTDILSVLASSKILALALPLIGDVIIGRSLWRQPFTSIGKSDINIGNLIVDAATQKPYEVKSELDFRTMFREYVGAPILCLDIRTGSPAVPGIHRITRPADNDLLANEIYQFLGIQPTAAGQRGIGEPIFKEIVGVLETSKTNKFSNLMDTRDVTYLFAVSKLKWSSKLDSLLNRHDGDPARRFEMIRDIVGEIVPTHSSITALLYDTFIRDIAAVVSQKISVTIPNSNDMPSIDFSNIALRAYQPGTAMFGQVGPANLIGGSFLR